MSGVDQLIFQRQIFENVDQILLTAGMEMNTRLID
jgi:hypothetical protein